MDSSADQEKDPVPEKRKRGRPPKKKQFTEIVRKHEDSFSLEEKCHESNSEEEDSAKKIKRRPGRPRKTDSVGQEMFCLSSPELSFLLNQEDVEPRGMTRQASKELALVSLRKKHLEGTTNTTEDAQGSVSQGQLEFASSEANIVVISSQESDTIEISSQSTEDNDTRSHYILISSQSESEFEEEEKCPKPKICKAKPRYQARKRSQSNHEEHRSQRERSSLGGGARGDSENGATDVGPQCDEKRSREGEKDPEVASDKNKRMSENKTEANVLSRQLATGEECKKFVDKIAVGRSATAEDHSGLEAEKFDNDSASTEVGSRLSESVEAGIVDSCSSREGGEINSTDTRILDENSNKVKNRSSKLFANFKALFKGKTGSSFNSSDVLTNTGEDSREQRVGSPTVSEKPDDGGPEGGVTAQFEEWPEKWDLTGEKAVRDISGRNLTQDSVDSAGARHEIREKVALGKDTPSAGDGSDKNVLCLEKQSTAAHPKRRSRSAEGDSENVYGNKETSVAVKEPHSLSMFSSLLATSFDVSETLQEKFKTSGRTRKQLKSKASSPLMEGDLLGSIIRGSVQEDAKKASGLQSRENTEPKKRETSVGEAQSLVGNAIAC